MPPSSASPAPASTAPPCRTSARRPAISPGALYVYFDSKEALIAGICERDRAEFAERLAALADAPDFLQALRELGEHYFVHQPAYKNLLCIEIGLESTRNPRVGEIHRGVDEFIVCGLREAVPAHEDEGRIAPDHGHPDAGQAARPCIGDGLFWRRAVDPGLRRPQSLVPATLQVLAGAAEARSPSPTCPKRTQEPIEWGSIMRKILIGVVLALAFAMISLTLVGRSLPRPTGPAESQAAKELAAADLFAAGRDRSARRAGRVRRDGARHRLAGGARGDPGGARGRGPAHHRGAGRRGPARQEGRRAGAAGGRHARCPGGAERRGAGPHRRRHRPGQVRPSSRPRRVWPRAATPTSAPSRCARPAT